MDRCEFVWALFTRLYCQSQYNVLNNFARGRLSVAAEAKGGVFFRTMESLKKFGLHETSERVKLDIALFEEQLKRSTSRLDAKANKAALSALYKVCEVMNRANTL
ncbi:MAG: hypothetical protein LBL52_02510 [Rickettsiales bacterium]|jgi:hypothetical protein|nr:hypothetical protein [Rickettsiales bacterium]